MYKLVRIDTEEPSEIQLPAGTYLIGRDKLIGFDDKRLSYNQGLIIVKEDSVTIESAQRKIYLTKKGSKEKDILNKTFKTTLDFGDQFGFLENSFWFELQSNEPIQRALKEINVNTSDNSLQFTKESVVPTSPLDDEKPRKRKGWENPVKRNTKKRRKEESEDEVSDEQTSQEVESDELNGSVGDENSRPSSKRERCEYGGNCYSLRALRPNPAHKAHLAKYSHPRDNDWGTKKICPQGIRCEIRDAKHFKNYKHPPEYIRFRKHRPGQNTSDSDSDSSQEYRSDRLLRAKRERKPPLKEDLELEDLEGSESEEDPFASDGSEDWTPEP
ncbi:uncharacterized protein LOC125232114 [Leguminivora glycinivorella]|uniref:uncharacterized protein LOC125232114 n=1 Tax=Leguminivora glycinivorella TaxID=1035111 RepID=UPI00200F20CF|nr:uncharacterized protein LOC125232114 [Leguminivora glycinivorella]